MDRARLEDQLGVSIPADRKKLSSRSEPRESKWPRTSRRQQRIRTVLGNRQPDLTLVLENVHDPHNAAAVLRSSDSVGIQKIHLVYTEEDPPEKVFARRSSASAAKWVDWEFHEDIDSCYRALRGDGFTIVATSLADGAESLFSTDLTQPTAIAMGNEMRGLSVDAVESADSAMYIPMAGMVQSLNISVACAVTLFEAFRQRLVASAYSEAKLSDEVLRSLEQEWLKR